MWERSKKVEGIGFVEQQCTLHLQNLMETELNT